MADKDIINELLSIEMMCEQLKQRCYMTRKKLEENSTPASPKGQELARKAAKAVGKRMRGITLQTS